MIKKWIGLAGILWVGLPLAALAEPIAFEQAANVTGMTGIEIGAEYNYSYEKIEQQGAQAVESTVSDIPVFVRLGFPVLELKITAPYGNLKANANAALEKDFSGFRNIGLGIKTGLLALPAFNLGIGLSTTFPTADPQKYIFGEGLDLNPFAAVDLDMFILKLHGYLSYEYRGDYNSDFNPLTSNNAAEAVKLKPGDAMHWALGIEIPTGDLFFIQAELLGTKYGEVKIDSTTLPDSSGSLLTFVPGLRLQQGPFKAKIGYEIPLEKKEDRPSFAPRFDWRIIAGVSLLFGM